MEHVALNSDGTCNITFDEDPKGPFVMTYNGLGNNIYNFTRTEGFIGQ